MSSVIGTSVIARAPRGVNRVNKSIGQQQQQSTIQKKETNSAGAFQTISEVTGYIEKTCTLLQSKDEAIAYKELKAAIPTLCVNLKVYGHQLETYFKDQMDLLFFGLRNASKDCKLDEIFRLHLLEVIELRAGNWAIQEEISSYYQSKIAQLSKPQLLSSPDFPESSESPPPILLPGETVKFSGKYTSGEEQLQSKVPSQSSSAANKISVKDEVVIRNADSGKVSPGAKERLVQITGSAPENIERARNLIEQTIQRNASPVRQLSDDAYGTSDYPQQQDGDRSVLPGSKHQQPPQTDLNLDEYQFTVNVGDKSIMINGKDLGLLKAAKIALDEHFGGIKRSSSFVDDGLGSSLPSSQQVSPREPAYSNDGSVKSKLPKHSRDWLLKWSSSPLCREPPTNYNLLCQLAPEILKNKV